VPFGLITLPTGPDLYIIDEIAPDKTLKITLPGSLLHRVCMVIAIILVSIFPGIATWLPEMMMGNAV